MILGNDYVDLAPLFSAHSTRNYLLSTLDFTDSVGVTSHKVAVSQLVESNESLFNKETSRFSSEHNVTKREQGKEYLIEIPYFLRVDLIKPQDVQGKRKPGTDFQETLTDIYADYVAKHHVAYQRTKESVLAAGFAPIFPDTCYHLTHYWPAAADIPVASDNPVHYAGAIRYNARTPLQGSLLPLTRLV